MPDRMPEILRKLREEQDYNQDRIAKHLGVVQQTYSNYEKGCSSLPLDYLIKLAQLYDVSSDFLLGLTSFRQSLAELEYSYVHDRTWGKIVSAMLSLSDEKRILLIEFMDYLVDKQEKQRTELEKLRRAMEACKQKEAGADTKTQK